MRSVSTIRLVFAEIAAVAINVIPLGLWLFDELPAESAMIIYGLESAAAIVLAVLCVWLISPSYDPGGSPKYKKKSKLLADFLIVSMGMIVALGLFSGLFIFMVLKASVDVQTIGYAFLIVLGFLLAEFAVNVLTLRPLPLKKAEHLLTRSMGRTALLFFGVFLGIFLAAISNHWFVVPFVVLKTIADIGEPIQFFLGKEDAGVPFEVEFSTGRK